MRNKYGMYVSVVCGVILVACAAYGAEKRIRVAGGGEVATECGMEAGVISTLGRGQFIDRGSTAKEVYESFKRFNVVCHPTIGNADTYHGPLKDSPEDAAIIRAMREGMEAYVRDGGGVMINIITGGLGPGLHMWDQWNLFLEGIGVEKVREGLDDSEHVFKSTSRRGQANAGWEYFYTTCISLHPVTKGVKSLYIPRYTRRDGAVVAFKLDKNWKVIVAGEKTCGTYPIDSQSTLLDTSRQGTSYKSSPPIVAVRSFGKGRILIHNIPPRSLYGNYKRPLIWEQITETEGDRAAGRPSHGILLLKNALTWLAEPSLGIEGFGTYVKSVEKASFPASVDWDRLSFDLPDGGIEGFMYPDKQKLGLLPPSTRRIKGIIGVHTSYTDGKGSVKDFADAAREAGLSFIVITDPLEKLTKKELADLKKDCEAVSGKDFYACPGVEFTDVLSNRWAVWGWNVIFPPETFEHGKRTYTLWDGKRILHTGHYADLCNHAAGALLDYRTLAKAGAHPENMWWFYRFCPFVYEGGNLIADNFGQYLSSLRDLRWLAVASFTRIRKPSEVAAAKDDCVTVLSNLESAKAWFTTRCGVYNSPAKPYVTQGPEIRYWDAINKQMEHPWDKTRGAQRVRLKFQVASEAGIREVKVHDADYGIVRRFAGSGAKTLEREFELVHDKQHYLVLEVTDENGRKAISEYLFVFCYKSGLYRCGDNLNLLCAARVAWHPDRNQMLSMSKLIEDALLNIPAGFDTAGGGGLAPITDDLLRTTEGQLPREGIVGRILDVKQGSYDLQICAMTMDHASERHETAERPGPALASIPRNIAPLPYERTHTAYTLRSRADYFIAWNLRRVHEGMKDYRGGIVWHEGRIRFKEDMTLNGPVPVPFLFLCGGDHMFVTDADRGTLGIALLPEDKEFSIHGRVAPGGYVANMPNPIGYTAFFSSSDSEFFYQLQDWNKERASIDRLYIGLGRDGQKIKAGTEMSYRFMMASLNMRDRMVGNLELEDIRRTYNLDGGTNGYPFNISVGKLEDAEFFFTVKAKDNEAVFDIGPRRMICDLAFRIKGIEDNGCAAVYNHSAKYFRFVADADNTAYFQESIEKPVKIWAGNPFVCDDKAVKLCLVVDGQAKGKPPFLEVHNPTDKEIKTRVFSPEHTPVFAGMNAELTIPKGESLMVGIKGGKLILNSRIQ